MTGVEYESISTKYSNFFDAGEVTQYTAFKENSTKEKTQSYLLNLLKKFIEEHNKNVKPKFDKLIPKTSE
ncbi:hypothetical protein [Mycoplasmopsis agalactiae]|uniref:hypothetical protein n=1 Tax=Mycoplasmopsis agalactiae TaxID=2110 RepID=UPI00030B16C9|nr:hypothetical protein [Mycoplasmopsis agalactiae]